MVAIIPARGGSKGLPGKNIKMLLDKPLIAYTIQAALNSSAVHRVIVSTDSEEIAEVSRQYGGEVPFMRPDYLATDNSIAIDTYIYTIEKMKNDFQEEVEDFIVLLPTCPFRSENEINEAVSLFKEKKADSVISYTPEHHPVSWHRYLDHDGCILSSDSEKLSNRQDNEVSYYPNGAIYVFRRELILNGKYYSNKSYAYVMNRHLSVDIDTQEDFDYAEYLIKKKNNEI